MFRLLCLGHSVLVNVFGHCVLVAVFRLLCLCHHVSVACMVCQITESSMELFLVLSSALPIEHALIVVTISLCVCVRSLLVELETKGGGGNSTITNIHQNYFQATLSNIHFLAMVELTPPSPCK